MQFSILLDIIDISVCKNIYYKILYYKIRKGNHIFTNRLRARRINRLYAWRINRWLYELDLVTYFPPLLYMLIIMHFVPFPILFRNHPFVYSWQLLASSHALLSRNFLKELLCPLFNDVAGFLLKLYLTVFPGTQRCNIMYRKRYCVNAICIKSHKILKIYFYHST